MSRRRLSDTSNQSGNLRAARAARLFFRIQSTISSICFFIRSILPPSFLKLITTSPMEEKSVFITRKGLIFDQIQFS